MADGTKLFAPTIISNATPYHTFMELLPGLSKISGILSEETPLSTEFLRRIW